jgi:hypothetical protein
MSTFSFFSNFEDGLARPHLGEKYLSVERRNWFFHTGLFLVRYQNMLRRRIETNVVKTDHLAEMTPEKCPKIRI